ncbi:MAG: MATE family efflux transporter [Lachnospiraceae bacterium]|nr:MATE family efflux transporter [Lachnospiraceae bacterium]
MYSRTKNSHEIDMLHGPLLPKIVAFSLPLALSNALQLLFNAADIVIVGRYAGSGALAAVGATTVLVNLIVNFFVGISMGANIFFASGYAAGKKEQVSSGVHTAMVFSLLSGLGFAAAGIIAAEFILGCMKTPGDIFPMSVLYFRIYLAGLPAIICYNFGSAALRSMGDTQRPMYYLLFSGVLNVILNLITVIGMHMGVAGVALATTVSNFVSASLVVRALMTEVSCFRLVPSMLRIDVKALKDMLRLGLPSGIQSSMFGIANVLIQSSINSFGAAYIAGNAASVNIEGFILTVISAFSAAGLTFGSQNIGAGLYKRADEVFRTVLISGVPVTFACGVLTALFRVQLVSIYNPEPAVIAVGSMRVLAMLPLYWLEVIMNGYSSAMRSLGHTLEPMVIAIVSICIFRIIYLHTVFAMSPAYETLLLIWPLSWALSILASIVVYRKIRRRYPAEDVPFS